MDDIRYAQYVMESQLIGISPISFDEFVNPHFVINGECEDITNKRALPKLEGL